MAKEKEKPTKSKKVNWMRPHECMNCKKTTTFLLCNYCGKISIKS